MGIAILITFFFPLCHNQQISISGSAREWNLNKELAVIVLGNVKPGKIMSACLYHFIIDNICLNKWNGVGEKPKTNRKKTRRKRSFDLEYEYRQFQSSQKKKRLLNTKFCDARKHIAYVVCVSKCILLKWNAVHNAHTIHCIHSLIFFHKYFKPLLYPKLCVQHWLNSDKIIRITTPFKKWYSLTSVLGILNIISE